MALALALRRQALQQGGIPATLEGLVEDPRVALPTDARDGGPIPYERTDDGCVVGDGEDATALSR